MPANIPDQTQRASGPRAPEVLIAIGTKWWDLDSRVYFSLFLAPADDATDLASLVASDMYEAAKLSTQVMSQTRHWPDFHMTMEQPSDRLPSDLHRLVGWRVDGTLTAASDLCTMALTAACREKRPWLLTQLSPWLERASTWLPQWLQMWGWQSGVPRHQTETNSSVADPGGEGLWGLKTAPPPHPDQLWIINHE